MRKYRVALAGYYGFGNLGDELLLEACLNMFTNCGLAHEQIIVLSSNPEETSRNFHVPSVSRWSLREVMGALRSSYALVFGGGGIFQDTTSVKSCIWYWGLVRLARLLGCRVWALGQSVGPLSGRLSRYFAGDALRQCEAVHVRDENSFRLARELGCSDVTLGSDLVMTLKPKKKGGNPSGYMLVNLRPCRSLMHYAEIIKPYTSGAKGAALSDEDISALGMLGLRDVVRVRTFEEACGLWGGASCAVGMRLHFGVLSRMFGVPLSMMPYDVKVSEFARQSGVPCIAGQWVKPVMPREVPGESGEIECLCGKISAWTNAELTNSE